MPRRPARDEPRTRTAKVPMFRIRRMVPSDIDFARWITDLECWGFVPGDFTRLLSLTPRGSFIASAAGRRVGLLTTILQGDTCWIGNVVVAPALRGNCIGSRLVAAAMDYYNDRGISKIGLISRANTVHFYERLGFDKGHMMIGMGGIPKRQGAFRPRKGTVPISEGLLPDVIRLDEEAGGLDRAPMIARLFRDFKTHFLVRVEDGEVKGFIVGKPGTTGLDVGPWICAGGDRKAARELFSALVSHWGGPVETYVPGQKGWATSFLRRAGLERIDHFFEMTHGWRRRASRRIELLAPAGLEKG